MKFYIELPPFFCFFVSFFLWADGKISSGSNDEFGRNKIISNYYSINKLQKDVDFIQNDVKGVLDDIAQTNLMENQLMSEIRDLSKNIEGLKETTRDIKELKLYVNEMKQIQMQLKEEILIGFERLASPNSSREEFPPPISEVTTGDIHDLLLRKKCEDIGLSENNTTTESLLDEVISVRVSTHQIFDDNALIMHNTQPKAFQYLYGLLEKKDEGRTRIHSFEPEKPEGKFIELSEFLKIKEVSMFIPKEAFFRIYRDGVLRGEFTIEVEAMTPRAMNFLLLASGIIGESYKDTYFPYIYQDTLYAGYKKLSRNSYKLFPSNFKGIADGGVYSREERPIGMVGAGFARSTEESSFFYVQKTFDPSSTVSRFAHVEEGLDFLLHGIEQFDYIKECGFII